MRRTSITLALLLFAPLVSAQVYKWTDAQGTTHFSETPPAGSSTKYSQVSIAASNGSDMSATPAATSSESKPETSAGAASGNPKQTSLPVPDNPENRAKLCASLKTNIATLLGAGPVVMQNAGGPQQLLNSDQRKQQLDASQSQYQQYCSNK